LTFEGKRFILIEKYGIVLKCLKRSLDRIYETLKAFILDISREDLLQDVFCISEVSEGKQLPFI